MFNCNFRTVTDELNKYKILCAEANAIIQENKLAAFTRLFGIKTRYMPHDLSPEEIQFCGLTMQHKKEVLAEEEDDRYHAIDCLKKYTSEKEKYQKLLDDLITRGLDHDVAVPPRMYGPFKPLDPTAISTDDDDDFSRI